MIKAAAAERHAARTDVLAADVGQRIREARLERGMTLAQLGGDDLSRSFLSLVELGKSRISLRALAIVAERLILPMSYFLTEGEVESEAVAELLVEEAFVAHLKHQPHQVLRLLPEAPVEAHLRARALWLRGYALLDVGRVPEATTDLREALAVSEQGDDVRQIIQTRYALGMALYRSDLMAEAREVLAPAIDLALKIDDQPLLGTLLVALGHLYLVSGNTAAALGQYARARELYENVSDPDKLAAVYSGLSAALKRQGDLRGALRYSRLAAGIFESQHYLWQAANEFATLANRYLELGDLAEAQACADQAITRAQTCHAPDIEALARSTLATVYLRQGQREDAIQEADQAIALASNREALAYADALLVRAELAQNGPDQADALYTEALDILEQLGLHARLAAAALAYSDALEEQGDLKRALDFARRSARAQTAR